MTASHPINVAHPDRFFIGGQWVELLSTNTIDLVSPANEHVFMSVAAASAADMDRAVDAAREAFDNGPWPRLSPAERAGYLRRLAEALRARTQDLAVSQTRSMGAPLAGNVEYTGYAIAFLDMYAQISTEQQAVLDEASAPTAAFPWSAFSEGVRRSIFGGADVTRWER